MRQLNRARLLGVFIPLAAMLVAVQPALAHVTKTSGSPGSYVVTDSSSSPGAHCFYPKASASNNDLSKIKIRPPSMFAKHGTQWVGWQYSIQHGTTVGSAPAGWKTYYKSPVMKKQATTGQAAAFTTQTWIAGNHINRWWRVKLLMFWYQPGSKTTISGQVNDLIDWYTWTYPPNPDMVNQESCIPGE